jgi:molybdopterin-synthase adenylyltransferase
MLTDREQKRYERQIRLFSEGGQERLKDAEIFIAGAGGLGSVTATYLAAAGVGRIRIADCDTVDWSNLNRQFLHLTPDLGREKAVSAEEMLAALNDEIEVEAFCCEISEESIPLLIGDAELIVDALDNYSARYLLNRAALERGIPLFHGAVSGFSGQATTILPGKTACIRCFIPRAPPSGRVPIVGATCGIIGSVQATEVIKYIVGTGTLLANRLFLWDGLTVQADQIALERDPRCSECGTLRAAGQI